MKHEILASKPIIWATAAIASLAIAGCGEDDGTVSIESCANADGVAQLRPDWQLHNVAGAQEAILNATASIKEHMHQHSAAAESAHQQHVEGVDEGYLELAYAAFHYSYPWFDVSDETRLNDKSEMFCYGAQKDEIYYTPRAEAVIQALVQRDVHISSGMYDQSFDRLVQSIAQYNEEKLTDFTS